MPMVPWLDRVLEAIWLGVVLCQQLAILHHQASTFFMLHSLLADLPVEFSRRHKEPAGGSLLYHLLGASIDVP